MDSNLTSLIKELNSTERGKLYKKKQQFYYFAEQQFYELLNKHLIQPSNNYIAEFDIIVDEHLTYSYSLEVCDKQIYEVVTDSLNHLFKSIIILNDELEQVNHFKLILQLIEAKFNDIVDNIEFL